MILAFLLGFLIVFLLIHRFGGRTTIQEFQAAAVCEASMPIIIIVADEESSGEVGTVHVNRPVPEAQVNVAEVVLQLPNPRFLSVRKRARSPPGSIYHSKYKKNLKRSEIGHLSISEMENSNSLWNPYIFCCLFWLDLLLSLCL